MQYNIASSSAAATFNNAAFSAQPFAGYQAFMPTIKLAGMGVPSNVKLAAEAVETAVPAAKPKKATVAQMIAEGLELAKMHDKYSEEYVVRGNKALYEVLDAIYGYTLQISSSLLKDEIIKQMVKVLKDDYSIKTTSKTNWLTTVVKLIVKGTDRQTANNYSRVLQVALDENLAAGELAQYIERRGGVAKIRTTEANSVAVNTASDIAKARGALVKDYYVNTAIQSKTTIECDMPSQTWGGDGRTTSEHTKLTVGKFDFFITMSEGANRYRVVEHGIFSEALENQIIQLIAKTFRQSTDDMQAALTELKVENVEFEKASAAGPAIAMHEEMRVEA
jgi:hypothetical protein